jgi:predicted nucleotidyltransferase
MDRQTVIDRLRDHEAELRAMGVTALSLFGSVARDEAGPASDVDVALTLDADRHLGLFRYVAIGERLEDILGVKVDTVSEPVQKERLRQRIEQETIPQLSTESKSEESFSRVFSPQSNNTAAVSSSYP